MSKAFTRESDDAPDAPHLPRTPRLPPGAPNYLTAAGARRLREELDRLQQEERSGAATPEAQPEIARRIEALTARLDSAQVVDPASQDHDRVHFGATVTVRDDGDHEIAYHIVGVDEADPRHGAISWVSPVARALLGAGVGDLVTLPGKGEVEIADVAYEA